MDKDIVLKNRHRADCYRLISACYSMPGKTFVEEDLAGNLCVALEAVCPEAVPHAKKMGEALGSLDMKKDILVDYSALFVGPFKLLAPPYGSVYLDKGRTLMGDSTVDAVQTYRKAGVEMDPDQKDMPDHISVELEFFSYLITKELEAQEGEDSEAAGNYHTAQEDFMSRHISAWVFKFTKDLQENAKTSFYTGLADCTAAFLQAEMNSTRMKMATA